MTEVWVVELHAGQYGDHVAEILPGAATKTEIFEALVRAIEESERYHGASSKSAEVRHRDKGLRDWQREEWSMERGSTRACARKWTLSDRVAGRLAHDGEDAHE